MHNKTMMLASKGRIWKLFESVFMYFNASIFDHLGRREEKKTMPLSLS